MNDRSFGIGAVLASILVCLFATHCDMPANQFIDSSGATNPTGKLQLLLTDQPEPFEFIESAVITITRIEVRQDTVFEDNATIDLCTTSTCVDGACIPMATDCDDGDACTEDACDPSTGACSHTPMTCAAEETCMDGQCLSLCANDAACDDSDPCTNETCMNGGCVLSDKCVSADPCTNVSCNPNSGLCIFVSSFCDVGQVCFDGGCVTPCAIDGHCDDNDMCTTDVCGPNFACEYITTDCDDGDTCTRDSCDPATGMCMNDDIVCAANEICVDGICYMSCVDSTECNSAGGDDDSDEVDSDDSDDSGDEDSEADSDDENEDDSMDDDSNEMDVETANDDDSGDDDEDAAEVEQEMDHSNSNASSNDDQEPQDSEDGSQEDLDEENDETQEDSVGDEVSDSDEDSDEESDDHSGQDDSDDEQGDSSDDDDSEDNSPTQKGLDEDDDNQGSFIVIFEGGRDIDLLELQNGSTDLLADTDIPAGKYSQMRLIVTEGEVTLTDGRVFPLSIPSGEQTGIKLHFDFDIRDGEETILMLDVDLSRAFQPIPGGEAQSVSDITDFMFRPSIAMRLISVE